MKSIKMIQFDMKNFFLKNRYRFFLPVVFSVVSYFILCSMVSDYQEAEAAAFHTWEQETVKVTFLDWWYYIFAGLAKTEIGEKFEVPACWLAVNLFLFYMLSGYLSFSMKGMGRLVMIKCSSERRWWLTKGVLNFFSLLIYYVLLIAPVVLITAIRGCLSGFQPYVAESQGLPPMLKEGAAAVFQMLVLPVFISLALLFFMEWLELSLGASLSFLCMAVFMIVSAYLSVKGLDGIFLMLRRTELFMENGVSWQQILSSGTAVIFCTQVLGCRKCRKTDIGLEGEKQ